MCTLCALIAAPVAKDVLSNFAVHGVLLDGAEAPVGLDVEYWASVCIAPMAEAFCVLANFEFATCVTHHKEKAICFFFNLQQVAAFQAKVCATICCCDFNVCCRCFGHLIAPLCC